MPSNGYECPSSECPGRNFNVIVQAVQSGGVVEFVDSGEPHFEADSIEKILGPKGACQDEAGNTVVTCTSCLQQAVITDDELKPYTDPSERLVVYTAPGLDGAVHRATATRDSWEIKDAREVAAYDLRDRLKSLPCPKEEIKIIDIRPPKSETQAG